MPFLAAKTTRLLVSLTLNRAVHSLESKVFGQLAAQAIRHRRVVMVDSVQEPLGTR